MFNKNFNIIFGERASGRTFFLWEISKILKTLGYKICFLGCTNEFNQEDKFLSHFDFCRVLPRPNDYPMIEMIKEITERDKYDFIFVDDFDLANKRSQEIIKSINVRKVCSCTEIPVLPLVPTTDSSYFKESFSLFKIRNNYDDSNLESRTLIEYKGNVSDIKGFLLSLSRELKINNVLK